MAFLEAIDELFYLMEHYIGVRNHIVWKRAQITLNTRVSL